MKKLLILISIFIIQLSTLIAQDTFINSYPYEDLWPPEFNFSNAAYACNVIPAIGGGYLLQAFVEPYLDIYSEPQCMFWKISEEGVLEWRKQDNSIFGFDYFRSIVSNGVDRYYAISSCGWLGQQTRLFILDENCDLIDVHPYWTIDTLNIRINSMQILDDGLIMAGYLYEESVYAGPFIMKTDFEGNIIWQKDDRDFGIDLLLDELNSIIQTSDNGFLACGYRGMNPGTGRIYKLDAQGDTLWTYQQDNYQFMGVLEYTTDTYFVIANSLTVSLLEFSSSGELLSSYDLPINSLVSQQRWSASLWKSSNDNLIIYYNADEGELHEVSPQGEILWNQNYLNDYHGLIGKCFNRGFIEETGNIIFCGTITYGEPPDILLIKTDENGNVPVSEETIIPKSECSLHNFPNPFNPTTTISFNLTTEHTESTELVIYNIKGQKIKELEISPESVREKLGINSVVWDGRDNNDNPVASGIYYYQLIINEKTEAVKKMLLMK